MTALIFFVALCCRPAARRLALFAVVAAGCGGVALPTQDPPLRVEASGCWWKANGDALDCLPDTPEGCICGAHDPFTGAPAGSCHLGGCCAGCWSVDDNKCHPGDGSDGLYGNHGASCRVPDWSGCGGLGQPCCVGNICQKGTLCVPSVSGGQVCALEATPQG